MCQRPVSKDTNTVFIDTTPFVSSRVAEKKNLYILSYKIRRERQCVCVCERERTVEGGFGPGKVKEKWSRILQNHLRIFKVEET